MTTDVASAEIRTLHRRITQLERRLAVSTLHGKVHPGSQDAAKRTVRLDLGKNADGRPILSPPVRWQQAGAGAFKMHSTPADNEQMILSSPSGTIGQGSIAMFGTYDRDTPAPSQATDAAVAQLGDASVSFKNGELAIAAGGVSLTLTAAGPAFAGGKLTHEGKNVGANHKHKDVEPGGGTSGPPLA
ncbi:phage baseplate assembly protein V [Methylopila sp. M107]|uniref:phage baseplate assembly protein V n=1 Tax=Methylopila sp. M107 TaxID=1101190 RepID=UPI00035FBE67|nr:phage baseplate assembly protein V [Methylopila sp. M107]